jgi:D-lactate dehydrogenase
VYYTLTPDHAGVSSSEIFSGFHIPTTQLEKFAEAVKALAAHEHVSLPLAGHVVTNTYGVYPSLSLAKVADKQKLFKLVDAFTKLVYAHGGTMLAEGGEGRLKARAIYAELDEKVIELYHAVRKVCDPLGTLNPGVKQVNDVRTLAGQLQDTHAAAEFARFGL